MAVLSAMVVWSECLFFVHSPPLSLFAVLVNAAKASYNYRTIEVKLMSDIPSAVTIEYNALKIVSILCLLFFD